MITPRLQVAAFALCALAVSCFTPALRADDKKEEKKIPPGVLKKYDANKDGQLDEKEMAAWDAAKAAEKAKRLAERLEKYDANKNGKLDPEELAKEKSDRAAMKAEAEKKKAEKQEAEKKKTEKKQSEGGDSTT